LALFLKLTFVSLGALKVHGVYYLYEKQSCIDLVLTHNLAGFRVATFRPAMQRYDKQGRRRERLPRENPPNVDFFVFSHGYLSPRHTKERDIPCVEFSASVCQIFAFAEKAD